MQSLDTRDDDFFINPDRVDYAFVSESAGKYGVVFVMGGRAVRINKSSEIEAHEDLAAFVQLFKEGNSE